MLPQVRNPLCALTEAFVWFYRKSPKFNTSNFVKLTFVVGNGTKLGYDLVEERYLGC